MFSICVPSYNSLPYLKILYSSLKKNFRLPHEFIVHDNGSSDDTLDWLKYNNINYTHSNTNLGFCAVNSVLKLAKYDYVFIVNTDMYFMPSCDIELFKQIQKFKQAGINRYTISCCLLEPNPYNPEYNYSPFGDTADNFDEKGLLETYFRLANTEWKKEDTIQFSHPIIVPKYMLEEINYLDKRYYPGYTSDYDTGKELYEKGCRNFVMLGNARVYHFSSKTFNQLSYEDRQKNGHDIFRNKWKQEPEEFRKSIGIKNKFEMTKDDIR